MKYIDAEKLITEIDKQIEEENKFFAKDGIKFSRTQISHAIASGYITALTSIKNIITSLQQEQPGDLERIENDVEL